jgi:glucoamylase
MNLIATYAQSNGSLSEQYSRSNGSPLSAYDLTWSYAAFLTAVARRAGIVPYSWGEPSASSVPAVCSSTSAQGSYTTATATSFPANQTPVTGTATTTGTGTTATTTAQPGTTTTTPQTSSTSTSCAAATSVAVTFNEIVTTIYGQTIKITGSDSILQYWNTGSAIPLSADQYTSSNHLWHVTINFPAGEVIQYKYINVASNGAVTWEADPNHTYTVPATCATAVAVSNTWQS